MTFETALFIEKAKIAAREWHEMLEAGDVYETTPELRDALSQMSGIQRDADSAPFTKEQGTPATACPK